MKISTATPQMTEGLKSLWRRVFGDEERYLELFFTRRYAPDQALVACDGTRPVSMLFLLPLTVTQGGQAFDARYIYAVATDPDARGRGLSSALLDAAHEKIKQEGAALGLLCPASPSLFDFYAARGFSTEFYVTERVVEADFSAPRILPTLTPCALADLVDLRNQYFSDCAPFARWDRAALAYQDLETALTGGETLSFAAPKPGYAVCRPTADAVLIRELVAPAEDEAVLTAIARRYRKKTLCIRQRASHAPVSFGMSRWVIDREGSSGQAPGYLSLVLD